MGDPDKIAQHRIAAFVAETIVDVLEKVDVERAKAKGRFKPLPTRSTCSASLAKTKRRFAVPVNSSVCEARTARSRSCRRVL